MPFPPLPADDLEFVLGHTREDFGQMRGRRLFLTGGTGFFGIWLLETFCHANERLSLDAKITVLTRAPDKFLAKVPHLRLSPEIDLEKGDVCDFAFPEGRFPFVIHAATDTMARTDDGSATQGFHNMLTGTRRVLDFARDCGAEKFLLTSSGAVYGRQPEALSNIPESYPGAPDPMEPCSWYGEGKRAAEFLCANHAREHGYEAKIARCFAFVGPHLPLDGPYAIGNFLRDAMGGGPINIAGDGTPFRSYLYAADLVVWLWRILFSGHPFRPYNVGSPDGLPISRVAEIVALALRSPGHARIAGHATPDTPISRYVPEISRAQKDLGLKSWNSLSIAIQKTASWHHPTWS